MPQSMILFKTFIHELVDFNADVCPQHSKILYLFSIYQVRITATITTTKIQQKGHRIFLLPYPSNKSF